MAAPTPSPTPSQPPQMSPTLPPTPSYATTTHHSNHQSPPSKSPINFSPPLIAMVVVAAAAFLFITYSRLISRHLFPPFLRLYRRRRRRRLYPPSNISSPPPPYESSDGYYIYSPYGLDEAVIKTIPKTIYNLGFLELTNDCTICLLEFEQGETIRTLPHCCHSFHVECIDMWLRSHATCPLCRAGVYLVAPPPLEEAARIRPSFDERILLETGSRLSEVWEGVFLHPLHEIETDNTSEIQQVASPENIQSKDHIHHQYKDFLLKRSYSFGFERNFFPSEEAIIAAAAATTTPSYHHQRQRRSFFFTKRPSSLTPFSSLTKSRVFSFRRTFKSSPHFFRRGGFFPATEPPFTVGGSSRRVMMKPLASSPLFGRHGGVFSSSRMRMGDPEALISPERYNRR